MRSAESLKNNENNVNNVSNVNNVNNINNENNETENVVADSTVRSSHPQSIIDKNMRSGALWNIIGSSLYALVSMVLGTMVIRVLGGDMGGIFFFAFSTLGQHIYVISYFGMRAIHSPDTGVEYTFGEYRKLRVWTAVAGIVVAVVVALAYSGLSYKAAVIVIVGVYRVLDGYIDVYECEMQRDGRLDLTGKSMTFRTLLVLIVFIAVMFISKDLIISSASLVVALIAAILIYDVPKLNSLGVQGGAEIIVNENTGISARTSAKTSAEISGETSDGASVEISAGEGRESLTKAMAADYTVRDGKVRKLFSESVWLFAAVFLDFLVFAASKYAVDAELTSTISGYYSTLFVPASAMQLFANFIVRPMLPKMSEAYLGGDGAGLKRMITTSTLVIGAVSVIAAVIAYFIGVPVLCIFAGSEAYETMINYRFTLALIVLAGGIYGMLTPLYYALVIGKQQRTIFWIYLVVAVIAFVLAFVMVGSMGLAGGAWSMVIALAVLFAGFYIVSAKKLWR